MYLNRCAHDWQKVREFGETEVWSCTKCPQTALESRNEH